MRASVGRWHARGQQPFHVFKLPARENGVGMQLLLLPRGSVTLGSPPDEPGHERSERRGPARPLEPVYVSASEVTRGQYRKVMGSVPGEGADEFPVAGVSWADAVEFCRKLGAGEGEAYRLPTEAEWEYACRAGSMGMFAGTGDLEEMGWYQGNSGSRPHPTAGKSPNHWGLYDMHGNVAEWCEDRWVGAGSEPDDPPPPGLATWRVVRGGSYRDRPTGCRSARRAGWPQDATPGEVGFRVVMVPRRDTP